MSPQRMTIQRIEGGGCSLYSNPRYLITCEGEPPRLTTADAGFCYAVGNPGMRVGCEVLVELTPAGRIRNMSPAGAA